MPFRFTFSAPVHLWDPGGMGAVRDGGVFPLSKNTFVVRSKTYSLLLLRVF
jgi:hypothetical protein